MHKIFVGLLLVFLDFNFDINTTRIGLIPDFLGYIIMIQGLREMQDRSINFLKVIPITTLALVLSIINYLLDLAGFTLSNPNTFFTISAGIAMTVISLYISYNIVQGVLDMQRNMGIDFNGNKLYSAWKLVAVFSILVYPLVLVPGLNIVFILLALVFNIYFLYQFNVTKITYQKSI